MIGAAARLHREHAEVRRNPQGLAVAPRPLYARGMESIVHVCNGDSTADSLSLADLPGEIRVWADALDQGPVLPIGDAEHYKLRGEYWAKLGGNAADRAQQLATYDKDFDEAAGAEELILWFEHDLFDQLALVRL